MRIVIVEDDPVQRRLLHKRLEKDDHEVEAFTNGAEAWAALQDRPCRMVISDWMMPELDGVALIRHIRGAQFPRYTYVILLTAREGTEDLVHAVEAGADDYVRKPVDFRELRARMDIGQRILRLEDDLRQKNAELEKLVSHDPLTGLNNRRAIMEHAEAEIQRALRRGGPVSLAMLDVDDIKSINDENGHPGGDDVLRALAEILVASVRPYDWVGRWGGEEFLLILPGVHGEWARRNVEGRAIPLRNGHTVKTELSAGVASLSLASTDLDALLKAADDTLYRAKRAGRNRVCLAGDDDQGIRKSA